MDINKKIEIKNKRHLDVQMPSRVYPSENSLGDGLWRGNT